MGIVSSAADPHSMRVIEHERFRINSIVFFSMSLSEYVCSCRWTDKNMIPSKIFTKYDDADAYNKLIHFRIVYNI